MIYIKDRKLPITPAQGRNILQQETDSFGTFFDLDRILEHRSYYMMLVHKHLPK